MPPSTVEDFYARVRQAGLPLSPAEAAAILPAWQKLEAWLDLVRTPAIPATAEPATTFRATP